MSSVANWLKTLSVCGAVVVDKCSLGTGRPLRACAVIDLLCSAEEETKEEEGVHTYKSVHLQRKNAGYQP
eukprot:3825961-Heterocapsa_arctica.AAC.1